MFVRGLAGLDHPIGLGTRPSGDGLVLTTAVGDGPFRFCFGVLDQLIGVRTRFGNHAIGLSLGIGQNPVGVVACVLHSRGCLGIGAADRLLGVCSRVTDQFVAMIEDVTEKRLLEQRVRETQRLESVGQLAGGVAHNFNNALTAISGYSELLLRGRDRHDPARQNLEAIQRVSEQAAQQIGQLLTFSRTSSFERVEFSLNDVAETTRDLLGPLMGDTRRIDLQLDEAHVDPGKRLRATAKAGTADMCGKVAHGAPM